MIFVFYDFCLFFYFAFYDFAHFVFYDFCLCSFIMISAFMVFAFMISPFIIVARVLFLFLRPMILVGSEPVWLLTYAFAYFSSLVLCFVLILRFIAFVLLPSAHGRGEVCPGVCFFFYFRVLDVVLNLPGEAHATCSPRLRWGEL